MNRDRHHEPPSHPLPQPIENGGEIRAFAAWMGLMLIAFGVAMAGYMFFRIGAVLLDPRAFETQVDRWEFVVRGRVSDALPDAYETPERTVPTTPPVTNGTGAADPSAATDSAAGNPQNNPQDVEKMAEFVGRVGSKSARPAALFLLVIILTILVRIVIAIIHAGIRLVYVTAGEKEYMKRIIEELVDQRR